MSEARNAQDLKNDGRKSANSDARNSDARGSLSDQRTSGRTLGCVGFSTILHAGLLLALAIAPLAIREAGGDNAGSHDGGVAMSDSQPMSVDMTESSATKASATSAAQELAANKVANADGSQVEVSVMTDETSDIELPLKNQTVKKSEVAAVIPLPEKAAPKVEKPVEKPVPVAKTPVAKIAKTPKTKPMVAAKAVESKAIETAVETESPVATETQEAQEQNEPAPVLLANPPSDDETPSEKEVVPEKVVTPPPVAVVTKEIEPKEEKEESPKIAAAPIQSLKSHGSGGNSAKEDASENAAGNSSENGNDEVNGTGGTSAAAMSSGSGNGQNENANGKEGDGTSAGTIAGPIRDASELKALSGNPNPVYPARDRLAHKEGTAVVLGRVSPDGRVTEVSLERSSGSANMDSASLQAFRSWRFQAGQQGWVRKPFQFRLVGDAKEVPAPLGKGLTR